MLFQKYLYIVLLSIMTFIILVLSITVDLQYRELTNIKNYTISHCDDSIMYSSDATTIANFIKIDINDEEVIRKCDRIIEYMNRSAELSRKTKGLLFDK